MKRILYSLTAVVLFGAMALGAGGKYSITSDPSKSTDVLAGVTYGTSYGDTLIWTYQSNVQSASLTAHWLDSVSVTRVEVYRIVDGQWMTKLAGDTLINFTSFSKNGSGNPNSSVSNTIPLAPLADQYAFVFVYAGGTVNGTNANTVNFRVKKQFSK